MEYFSNSSKISFLHNSMDSHINIGTICCTFLHSHREMSHADVQYLLSTVCLHTPDLCTLDIYRCRNPYFSYVLYVTTWSIPIAPIPFWPWSLSLLQRRQITPPLVEIKEYRIEVRYNWRGPPYHMIKHALQTVLHLYKKYSE